MSTDNNSTAHMLSKLGPKHPPLSQSLDTAPVTLNACPLELGSNPEDLLRLLLQPDKQDLELK